VVEDGVDGVWGTGEMMSEEEELAIIPSALISPIILPSSL
jgi:hypothetical protein